jgi:hypothetical protein
MYTVIGIGTGKGKKRQVSTAEAMKAYRGVKV